MTYTVTNTFVAGNLIKATEVNTNFTQAAEAVSNTSTGHDHDGTDSKKLDWDICWTDAVHDHSSPAEGGILGSGLYQLGQVAYSLLETTSFINRDYIFTDIFTTAIGKNSTCNTTSSTATYNSTGKVYTGSPGYATTSDTLHDPNTFTSTSNAFDADLGTAASKASSVASSEDVSLGKTFTSRYIGLTTWKVRYVTNGSAYVGIQLEGYNGASWISLGTLGVAWQYNTLGAYDQTFTGATFVGAYYQGLRVTFKGGSTGGTQTHTRYVYDLSYNNFTSNKSIICNNTSITLTGTEKGLTVYIRATTPTGTSVTVDITDGSTTISSQPINTGIDISSLSSGTLSITFNLLTTDTNVMPVVYGYSAILTV